MRPRNFRVEGFTCFADPVEIDFRGMDVFVIAGPTGAGKTTIIDAICYALYGRIPRGADTGALISHNRDSMRVALEFEAAGDVYRVSRGINVTRKTGRDGTEKVTRTVSPVVLEQRVGEDAWDPTEGRVKEIDAAIERIVGLDFDAFTRCVLLPQGQFQEFLAGESAKRDKILVELLGIEVYRRIMAAANARAAHDRTEAEGYERQLREDYADATEEALAACRAQLAAAGPTLEAAKSERDALNEAVRFADAVKAARRRQHERAEAHAKKLAEVQEETKLAHDGEKQLDELRALLERATAEIAAIAYDRALHDALRLALQAARLVERAEAEHEATQKAATDSTALDAAKAAAAQAEAKHASAQGALAEAEASAAAAQRDDAAAHIRQGLKPGDACPVCGGAVGVLPKAGKSRLAETAKALEKARGAEKTAAAAATRDAQAVAGAEQRQRSAVEQAQRTAEELERARAELREHLPAGMRPDVAAVSVKLEEQEAARRTLDELTTRRDAVRVQCDAFERRMAGSAQKVAALTAEANAIAAESEAAQREADDNKEELIALACARGWSAVSRLIDDRKDPGPALDEMRGGANETVDRLTRELARLQADERRIEDGIARAARLRQTRDELAASANLYRELATLLRADRFQEFVIEEAMQILAESATQHLETLYPRFQVDVERGEFVVVDTWQANNRRSAKTLSGGETFVASLALALALSERLPELQSGAAAALESLFLDEGFGTLDPETLDTVISALEGLRSEERMVGIITHVPELAQRIETRIQVRKSREGSTLETVGATGG